MGLSLDDLSLFASSFHGGGGWWLVVGGCGSGGQLGPVVSRGVGFLIA